MAKQVRRLNKRFVTFLTVGIMLVLTIAIGVLIMATSQKDPKVYADRGDGCMAKGDYIEAAQNYMKAYKYSKNDPAWLIKASEAQYRQGDIQYALQALRLAVTVDSTLVEAQKRLLELYWELWGRTAPAVYAKQVEEDADKLIQMIPEKSVEGKPELKKGLAVGYHMRGMARSRRKAEDSRLEGQAREDIQKAISLDPQPDYVQTLATMSLESAQQMARLAGSENIAPEEFDEYIRKMDESVGEAERLYLSLAKDAKADSETFVKLGDFYFYTWGMLEKSIGGFCNAQVTRIRNKMYVLGNELSGLEVAKGVSAEEKARTRQRLRKELALLEQGIPAWTKRAAEHDAKNTKCDSRALAFYQQGLTLAKDSEGKAEVQLALANYDIAHGQLAEADKLIRQAMAEDPNGYKAYRLFAMVMKQEAGKSEGDARKARIDEAIKTVSHRVNDLSHDFSGVNGRRNKYQRADLIAILVELYLDRQAEDDLANADKLLKELEQDAGENPVVYQLKATRAIAGKDFKTAIMLLEKADNLNNGRNPSVKMVLAELYSRTGNLGAAKKEVLDGLKLQPAGYSGLRLAMTIHLRLEEFEVALQLADQILRLPGYAQDKGALAMKLECLAQLGRMQEADQTAKELELAGVDMNWSVQKARLLLRRDEEKEAVTLLEQALAKDAGNKSASVYLVEIYSRRNELDKAKAVLKGALAKYPEDEGLKRLEELMAISDPKDRMARMQEISGQMAEEAMDRQLAQAEEEKDPFMRAVKLYDQYIRRDDLEKARKYLDEAVKLDKKKANPLSFRYALVAKDWDRARACADLAKTENLDSMNGLMYEAELANFRGWDLQLSQKPEEAKTYFEQSMKAAEGIIRLLPNDSQTRALLGEAYWWLDRRNEAVIQIAKALELNPSNPYALRASCVEEWEAISSAGSLASPAMVREFSQNLQKAYQQMPWDPWLKGRMEWLQSNVAKQREFQADEKGDAIKVVDRREKIRKEQPADIENLVRLAWVYENRETVRDLDKAEGCYQQGLEQKASSDLVRLYAGFASRHQRIGNVEAFLKKVAEKEATSGKGEGYTLLGYYYLMGRDTKQAEAAFGQAVKVEDSAAKRLDMAIFYQQTGSVDRSVEWCRKTLEAKADARQDRMVRSMLINSLLSMQRWDEAAKEIDQFKTIYSKEPQGKIYEARLALDRGKPSDSEGILTQILADSPDYVDALNLRSMVYLYTWQLEKAQADLEKIRDVNPRLFGLSGQVRLTKLYCEMGKTSEADRQARELIEGVQQSGEAMESLRRELLPSLASALEPRAYEDLLIWAANTNREYWGWLFERGRYAMLRLRYREASQAFAQTWQAVSKAPAPLKMLVLDSYLESMYKAKSYAELLSTASEATKEFKGSTSRILGWVSAANYAKGDPEKGFEAFRTVLASEANLLVVWQVTRGTILDSVNAREVAASLEKLTTVENPRNVRLALACAYFAADDFGKGETIYRGLAESAKDAKEKGLFLYCLGQEYTEKHKYPEAVRAFEESKACESGNLAVVNNLAYLLEEYLGKAQEARALLAGVYGEAPNNPDLLDTYGQVLTKLEQMEEGLYYTAKSVWIQESGTSRYHLGMILLSQNRRSEAAIQFRRALQLVGEDKDLEKQVRDALSKL